MVLLAYTVAGVKDNHVATIKETIGFNGLYAQGIRVSHGSSPRGDYADAV